MDLIELVNSYYDNQIFIPYSLLHLVNCSCFVVNDYTEVRQKNFFNTCTTNVCDVTKSSILLFYILTI